MWETPCAEAGTPVTGQHSAASEADFLGSVDYSSIRSAWARLTGRWKDAGTFSFGRASINNCAISADEGLAYLALAAVSGCITLVC